MMRRVLSLLVVLALAGCEYAPKQRDFELFSRMLSLSHGFFPPAKETRTAFRDNAYIITGVEHDFPSWSLHRGGINDRARVLWDARMWSSEECRFSVDVSHKQRYATITLHFDFSKLNLADPQVTDNGETNRIVFAGVDGAIWGRSSWDGNIRDSSYELSVQKAQTNSFLSTVRTFQRQVCDGL